MNPERIGRYEVRSVAGSGGFATVFEGFDPRLDARVAIKVLADNKSRNPDVRRRFRQEAVLLRRLQTEQGVPGLIEVFDIDETDSGQPFFVMGWADRGTVADRKGRVPWTPEAVKPLIQALTQSLGHLHAAGVVHRDIKPQNLLIRADRGAEQPTVGRIVRGERVYVGDLGLAKDLADGSSSMSLIGGTERYMAPEQLVYGGSVDHRADIYAATRMFEELLGGAATYGADTALHAAIVKGSAHDRNERFASMTEWQDAMLAGLADPAVHTELGTEIETAPDTAPVGGAAPAAAPVAPVASVPSGQVPSVPANATTPSLQPAPGAAPRSPATEISNEHRPPAPAGTSAAPRGLPIAAVAFVAMLAALAIGAFLFFTRSSSPIAGPETITSGETAVYTVDDADGAVRWVDPSGESAIDDSLSITGRLPGEVRFAAIVDGQRYERAVVVEESPDGPTIIGPDVVGLGDSATYTADVPAGQTFYWIHPTRGIVAEQSLEVDQLGTEFVIGLVSVDGAGVERGQQLRVPAE